MLIWMKFMMLFSEYMMEIEILTTKKKITKSILAQLEEVTFPEMEIFNSLNAPGYYINTPKGRVFLVETHSGWKKTN